MTRAGSRSAQHVVLVVTLTLFGTAVVTSEARAQFAFECVDELDDAQVTQRTRAIARQFQRHERHSRVFRFGWASLFLAFSVTEFAILGPRTDGAQRWNAYISGVGAVSAMLQLVALPMPGVWARRRIERMPHGTPQERRAQLRYALHALEVAANSDGIIHSPLSHGSAFVWGLTWGSVLSAKFDRPFIAAQSFLAGAFINELRILSAPSWATDAWTRARGGFCWDRYVDDEGHEPYWDEPQLEAQLLPWMGGLSLRLTY